ncbi:dihydrolipoyllysine-residue succinyltransferase component of 2-oxoglutarate dehydrogenase complex, mitochondrial-like [Saccoglossus kowalevskii]|uniref:Dihydrolipoyllysine-residue succinyltransferase component of 2-oxoglutarate dehydrogenase complex, mitochondrial n=1 Tax=Saccoglossus kowalevskii TaxID=10224 RepID=A0ABM0GWX6_SACKO|nr:PREDICTED: dihydrolipoyllysine-residue succinyltransferase component of 2-oxoglutarate dehydrogenase complex, mitochondrial-like [Saccoglossus kowalevskii]
MFSSKIIHTRNIPRFFQHRLTFSRLQNHYPVQRQYSLLAGACSSRLAKCTSCKTSSWCFRGVTGGVNDIFCRQFHKTIILYDEVRIVTTPAFAESVTEGDVRWEKAVGDHVGEDEVICEIETDKTSVQVPSPGAGIIEELFAEDGDTVTAGQQLFKIKITGNAPAMKTEAAAPPPPTTPSPSVPPPPPPPTPPLVQSSGESPVGPIPTVPPSVPPLPQQPMSSTPVSNVKPPGPPPSAVGSSMPAVSMSPVSGTRSEQRVKMNRMRMRIAYRLKEAQNTCAMLTTFNEIDMSNIMEMRQQHKDSFQKKHGFKLGFMSAFVKASAHSLQCQPVVNAVIDENEIVYRDYVDISVAVATPKGLVVPVIRNAETMNYADIERTINGLGEKARLGSLSIEDMDGGTFTISNGGVFGSMFGTPIINPPQSAILGMHAIFNRPMAVNGKVEIRPMMYVALTYDHRLIDGREAVTFLKKIKTCVEDPRSLLLDL